MKKPAHMMMTAAVTLSLVLSGFHPMATAQSWDPGSATFEYNAGPDRNTPMGQQMIQLYAELPESRYLSEQLTTEQKFRFTFGSMPLRTNFARNSVKIFAIGQDAVDDAELVKLPGTGTGYSTRVQSIANHFGVDQSLATSNASFQTIKGQYGSFDHVFVELDSEGKPQIRQSKLVDNYLWTLFNGENSSMRAHREQVWEWQIKNNPDSLRMLILFGGASHDAFAEFLIRRGFRVPPRMDAERLKRIQVPESRLVYAGGNNEFPVLQTKDGNDLYAILLGRKPDYTKPEDQLAAVEALKAAGPKAIEMMTFTGGGLHNSGVLNAAQLGGYDLSKAEVQVNGAWVKTNSLKGLRLLDGSMISSEIAFIASPHPTSLSKNLTDASDTVRKIFRGLEELEKKGWKIEPDIDREGRPRTSHHFIGESYKYGRAYLPKRVVPFGAPDSILRPEVSADRLGPQVLVSEPPSREELKEQGYRKLEEIFDANEIAAAKNALPAEPLNPNDLWSQHSRQPETRALFDSGPGAAMAKLMVESLDRKVLEPKEGMKVLDSSGRDVTLQTHGIGAYNVKSHSSLGFFAHYRGTFSNPRALILSDPADLEDRNTYRAATGVRGQAVNGLMRDLGLENSQLVLKTVPVDMQGATPEEWEAVRKGTESYREILIGKVLASGKIEVLFTDGPIAKAEAKRIMSKLGVANIPVIDIQRSGASPAAGIVQAGEQAKQLTQFRGATISGKPAAISPAHLPWNARGWEGNGGGHIVEAKGKFKGKVYAVVTPNFVAQQEVKPMPNTVRAVDLSKKQMEQMGIRLPKERISDFLKRTGRTGSFAPAATQTSSPAPIAPDGLRAPRVSPGTCKMLFGKAG